MTSSHFLLSVTLLLLAPLSSQSEPNNPNPIPITAAHTELTGYGFPIGLLPSSVQGYAINQTSGDFFVDLHGTCKITLPPDNYLATYSRKITGKIVKGRIEELDGIKVRAFFKWWSITGIKSTGDDLVFEVGRVTKKFPAKNFHSAPSCGGKRASS